MFFIGALKTTLIETLVTPSGKLTQLRLLKIKKRYKTNPLDGARDPHRK